MVTAQEVPQATELLGNHPNPFNPSPNIQYALSEDAHVTLRVYNMLGQVVATLVDEPQTAGYRAGGMIQEQVLPVGSTYTG